MVRLQDVLAAHQRAVEERIEEGLQRIREAAVEAARVAAAGAVEIARTPQGPDAGDFARSLLSYADERFQAMGLRLQRIEDAIRTLADRQGEPAGARAGDTERLAGLIRDLATTQREVVARLAAAQRAAISRLAAEQRAALEDLGRRTGRGVVAVARKLRDDMVEDIEGLRTSVRSMHRTLAWEGMARASRRPDPPGEEPSTD